MKRREALSALDVLALARELDAALKGAFVDKVHQLGPDDVLVKLNARGGAGRVNLVQVVLADPESQCAEHADTADSEHHLLLEAVYLVAPVEVVRDPPVVGGVLVEVGIER